MPYPTCPVCGALLINDGRCPRGHGRAGTPTDEPAPAAPKRKTRRTAK